MGLSGMQVMPHQQAAQVRGQGAVVWGSSYATAAGVNLAAGGTNGYKAWGRSGAQGSNGSIAVVGGLTFRNGVLSFNVSVQLLADSPVRTAGKLLRHDFQLVS